MMPCDEPSKRGPGDLFEIGPAERHFDRSATSWLAGQAVQYLNASDEEGMLSLTRVSEVLRSRQDTLDTIQQIYKQAPGEDYSLRWSLLYVLGDTAGSDAAGYLAELAIEPLPVHDKHRGCEGPQDMELLIRTMAVEALAQVAARHPETVDYLFKVVASHPTRPILIEAVKAAVQLGYAEKVAELLPEDERWILDIRKARIEELHAEPERADTHERSFTPPNRAAGAARPQTPCC